MRRIKLALLLLCCLSIIFVILHVYTAPFSTQPSKSLQLNLDAVIADVMDRLNETTGPDKSGSYLLVEDLLTSQEQTSEGKPDVTLATQCTSNHLHYVTALSQQWQGPVSVAVFTYDDDFHFAITSMLYLHLCVASVAEHVTFHLAFPTERRPDMSIKLPVVHNLCSNPPWERTAGHLSPKNFMIGSGIEYPVNLLRSLAVRRASTTHVFCTDVDLMPSDGLRSGFVRHIAPANTLSQTSTKLAYVVPSFEYNGTRETIPLNKSALLEKWRRREIQPFSHDICPDCQSATKYSRWRALPSDDKMAMGYKINYRGPGYEPFYIAQSSVPLYDERFKQWARDRQSQVCEMHVAGYQLVVLNNAFLVHDGYKIVTQRHATWLQEFQKNDILYRQFRQDLRTKYPGVDRTCTENDV